MIGSLAIRLGMITFTMAMIVWIGWTIPDEGKWQRDLTEAQEPASMAKPPAAAPVLSRVAAPPSVSGKNRQPPSLPNARTDEKLDLNRATEADLESLPGIGPVLAGRIVGYRTEVGTFRRVEDLREVKGIGKKKFDQLRHLVRVTGPLGPAGEGKKGT